MEADHDCKSHGRIIIPMQNRFDKSIFTKNEVVEAQRKSLLIQGSFPNQNNAFSSPQRSS